MDAEVRKAIEDKVAEIVAARLSDAMKNAEAKAKESAARAPWVGLPEGDAPKPAEVSGRVIRAIIAARGDMKTARDLALGSVKTRAFGEAVEKALLASRPTSGGVLLAPEVSTDIIGLLYANTVVRGSGAPVVNMPTGLMDIPRVVEGDEAHYIGEGAPAPTTSMKFGKVTLVAKKLAAFVPISNSLLRFDTAGQADTIVRNDLARKLAVREDKAFLRGSGAEGEPKGMRYACDPTNVTASAGTSLAQIRTDLKDLLNALATKNVPMTNVNWFMNPAVANYLRLAVSDGNGNLVFAAELAQGRLMGYPVRLTTSIPTGLGSGGDETEVILADVAETVIGETTQILISASEETAYYDESGNVVSAFQSDMTVVRAITEHDFALRHAQAVAVKTGVKWY